MSESEILENQKHILSNQDTLLANQGAIEGNQKAIKDNQQAIKKNQVQFFRTRHPSRRTRAQFFRTRRESKRTRAPSSEPGRHQEEPENARVDRKESAAHSETAQEIAGANSGRLHGDTCLPTARRGGSDSPGIVHSSAHSGSLGKRPHPHKDASRAAAARTRNSAASGFREDPSR